MLSFGGKGREFETAPGYTMTNLSKVKVYTQKSSDTYNVIQTAESRFYRGRHLLSLSGTDSDSHVVCDYGVGGQDQIADY